MANVSKAELYARVDAFEVPTQWDRSLLPPMPTTEGDSLKNHKGSHVAKLVQMLPFITSGWLRKEHFTRDTKKRFEKAAGSGWVGLIQECLVAMARSCYDSFAHSLPSGKDRARIMHETATRARGLMAKLFPKTMADRQNAHSATHKARSALQYGTGRVSDCRRLETNHSCARCVSTNHQQPEVKMVKVNNVNMCLHGLTHSDLGKVAGFGPKLLAFIDSDPCVRELLFKSAEANTYAEGAVNMEDEAPTENLTVATRDVVDSDLDNADLRALKREYQNRYPELELPESGSISPHVKEYKWLDVAGKPKFQRRICVGGDYEIWTLRENETASDIEKNPYVARVNRILGHRLSPEHEEVLWVDLRWFVKSSSGREHKYTKCAIYARQDGDRTCTKWNTMYTPSDVLRPVHLIHRCTTLCASGERGAKGRPMLGAKPTNRRLEHVVQGGSREFVLNGFFVG